MLSASANSYAAASASGRSAQTAQRGDSSRGLEPLQRAGCGRGAVPDTRAVCATRERHAQARSQDRLRRCQLVPKRRAVEGRHRIDAQVAGIEIEVADGGLVKV